MADARVVVVGAGAIGSVVAAELRAGRVAHAALAGVVRSGGVVDGDGRPVADLLGEADIVVEAAGHDALRALGPIAVAAGADLVVCSAGALVDDDLRARLGSGPGTLHLIPGALGGLDALRAARRAGPLRSVTLRSTKAGPALVRDWMAPALQDGLGRGEPLVAFDGTAREAARRFPESANVAATLGLCGVGLDDTHVTILGGPVGSATSHVVEASGPLGDLVVEMANRPSPDNRRTSAVVPWSAIDTVARLAEAHARRDVPRCPSATASADTSPPLPNKEPNPT
ncbi:MAG: aspartate dehydrogenase domain-containing protein [Actinomycetota bacterium]|nr:aspartate dehydrogenase domain-containing protein [Actinomycetota bacterium]